MDGPWKELATLLLEQLDRREKLFLEDKTNLQIMFFDPRCVALLPTLDWKSIGDSFSGMFHSFFYLSLSLFFVIIFMRMNTCFQDLLRRPLP